MKSETKSAFISVIGPSNAGKSTFVNSIVGTKVSIVTHKVQTTHGIVRGILTKDKTQLVFLDTPGIFSPKFYLEKKIVSAAWKSTRGIDLIIVMIDAANGITENVDKILKTLGNGAIIVINKIDLIDKPMLLKMIDQIAQSYTNFKDIFSISAIKNSGIKELKDYLIINAPEEHWYFDGETKTDAPIEFTLSEITREKLFLRVHQEIPYSSMVETESIKEEDGLVIVRQIIYVLNENHKKIVIGKEGNVIKFIREKSMYEMSKTLKKRVNLFIFIKVKPNWQEDKEITDSISYL